MKNSFLPVAFSSILVVPLIACEEKTPAQKTQDKVEDALDRRPHEKIKDAAEDIRDDAKDAAKKTGEAVKNAAQEAKEAAQKAADAAKEDTQKAAD